MPCRVLWFKVVLVVLATSALLKGSQCSLVEKQLIRNLTADYDSNVRPVKNISTLLTVTIDIALNQIIDLDEKNQILKTMCWMRVYWYDEYMTWTPSDYGGVKSIRLPPKLVWKPDITLYNDVGEIGMTTMLDYNVQFYPSGYAAWLAPVPLISACKLNMAEFPHDQQFCKFTFGSWTFHGLDVDMVNKTPTGDYSSFVSNGEWFVDAFPVERKVQLYNCCPEPYPSLTYTIVMSRRPLYYVFNLLLPCVVIIAITAMGFLLPAESGEKVSLMITCMLSITVFLLLVAETMPANSESVPWIGAFFAASIILVALSTVICVLVITSHHHGTHGRKIPYILRKLVFNYLSVIVFKRQLVRDLGLLENNNRVRSEQDIKSALKRGDTAWVENISQPGSKTKLQYTEDDDSKVTALQDISRSVNDIRDHIKSKEDDERTTDEWQLFAIILDQLFFGLFLFITLVLAIYIFTYKPPRP